MRKRTLLLVVLACAAIGFAALAAPPTVTLVETADGGIDVHFSEAVSPYSTVELGDWNLGGTEVASSASFETDSRLHIDFETAAGAAYLVTYAKTLTYDLMAGVACPLSLYHWQVEI